MDVLLPGGRDVRATLDEPDTESDPVDGTDRVVVACPPHPQLGGSRSDSRLRGVSDALTERNVACLRFDYGRWDDGHGERADARNAVRWAGQRYDRVGIFGYSFGGAIAVLAAADPPTDARVEAVSALAPASRLSPDLDAAAALADVDCPVQIIYGERDDTADWEPIVERARELGQAVEAFPADHHFVGRRETVGELAAEFLAAALA